ncbi:MAG: HD-GYP domain-containing protein [Proteobacteria bacterium]|nr:HD-GYP domain-containing protein [Pseudomonadota bacterium]MBU4354723.1 HD-GYP domain-containing protein [Pseudomonadota bacterium]
MQGGAQDYLVKHNMNGDLIVRSIRHAIERGKIEQALRLAQQELEQRVEERTAELSMANLKLQEAVVQLEKAQGDLESSLLGTVQALAATVESRDPYTAGHQRRVAELSVILGRRLGLPEDRLKGMYLAAMVHDLGKISVPAEILSKPGKLSEIELGLIKNHSQAGFEILKDIPFPWPIAQIILQHHERLDGSGYPHGLSGEEILKEARIMAVADVVEAMCSHRPYRPALDVRVAKDEIWSKKGVAYDPDVAGILYHHFDEIWQSLGECKFGISIGEQ